MKPTFKFTLITLVFISVFSCSKSDDMSADSELQITEKTITAKQIEIEVLEEVNAYRISQGLSTLKTLNIIKTVANKHTNFMVETGKMSHDNFNARSKYLISHANANRVGENVAYGYRSAKTVVKAWVKSDSHRATMEGDFNYFEVSAEQNENGVWFFTNLFIRK